MNRRTALAAGAAFVLATAASCRRNRGTTGGRVVLNGAGATLPFPLYSKWIARYQSLAPEVRINYQPIGSGAGIRQLLAGTIDFGASEVPVAGAASGRNDVIVHVPASVGAVAVSYNLPLRQPLRFEPQTVSAIYRGQIKRWNDPAIAATNQGVELPDSDITPVHRTDGSGTTAVFSKYLADVDPKFSDAIGVGKSLRWPTGLGAKGNDGVAGQVKTTPGAIGYMELAYARQNSLPVAALKNRAGAFVFPDAESATAAARRVKLRQGKHPWLVNVEGSNTYPIVAFTYFLVLGNMPNAAKGRELARFLWWVTHEGQAFAADLHYAPLPETVVSRVESRLKALRSGDKLLLSET